MQESDIRDAVDQRVRGILARHANMGKSAIRHELGVCEGRRRIDVAAINGHLDGWEIKSDADTLRRLPDQAETFSRVLDHCTLVTTERHLNKAAGLLPDWWGLWLALPASAMPSSSQVAGKTGQTVRLVQVRRPKLNQQLLPMAVAQLLWRDEALAVLRAMGCASGLSGRARHYVWERLVEHTSIDELRAVVRSRLTARQEWPGGRPQA